MTAVEALRDIADAIKAVFPLAEVWMRAEADACFSVRLPGVRPLVWVRYFATDILNDAAYYRAGGCLPAWWLVVEESWPELSQEGLRQHPDTGGQAIGMALSCLRRLAGNNQEAGQ